MMTHKVTCEVNDTSVAAEVAARLTLVDFLRQVVGLTGTHVGCEHGVCGACTVLVDGAAIRSCLMFAVQVEGKKVQTVEGLAKGDRLSPLQEAFNRHHALQCGFCTPGMLMTAHAFLGSEQAPTAEKVREILSGNICRCTGYVNIVEAVLDASPHYKDHS